MNARTEEGAAATIDAACKELRLPTVRAEAGAIADGALRAGLTHRAYLADVLAAEVDDRTERRRHRRIADARFPRTKRLEDFDCGRSPVKQATLAALRAGSFIERGNPVVLLGDSARASPICSSAPAWPPPRPVGGSATPQLPRWSTSWLRQLTTGYCRG